MMFMAVNGCVIVLRETAVQWYQPSYKSPFYPWVQIFGIISGGVLLVVLGGLAVVAALIIVLIGSIVYYSYGRFNAQRSGVLKTYGYRSASFLFYRKSGKNVFTESDLNKNTVEAEKNTNLDGALLEQAETVIPLFGNERSPEVLVEMGAALAQGVKVQVVHILEVPDITVLDALINEENPFIDSLNRRITAMSKERQIDVYFESAVTHDLVQTVHNISTQTECKWLVAGWDGKSGQGLFVSNPIGWLVTHIDCNFALFKDNGVRYFRKILVALSPGRTDPEFITACDRIADFYKAEITLVRVISTEATDQEADKHRQDSEELIKNTISKCKTLILKGSATVSIIAKASAAFDLLIIGTPIKRNGLEVLFRTDKDKFVDEVACSVIRLSINV
jgi:hypothetical protein